MIENYRYKKRTPYYWGMAGVLVLVFAMAVQSSYVLDAKDKERLQSITTPAAGKVASVHSGVEKTSKVFSTPIKKVTKHEPITLTFTGDVLLDKSVGEAIKKYGVDYPFAKVASLYKQADIAAVNLETSVSTRGSAANKQFTFRSRPETVKGLSRNGVDVVSLANNHANDYGHVALLDTIGYLDKAGIGHTGAGKDEKSAYSAYYNTVKGKRIAILGISRVLPEVSWYAGKNRPGIAQGYTTQPMMSYVKTAVKNSDYTIIMIHWNRERQDYPESYARQMGKMFVDAGVDAVIGSHSHTIMGMELQQKKPILYSLGNHVFTNSSDPRGKESLIVKLTLDNGKVSTQIIPAKISNGQPRLMDKSYNQSIYNKLNRISYGVRINRAGVASSR
ncbi:CapA family protein [Fictibacillus sp. B-59209]|uniref:CapA family protein n=1 Tax=Fictibacillus sp. B-59209 TaxID=3024873 RepID=UPI002E1BD155|nr:CapA family protein [Fictibacillus sp. B-59209]